MEWEEMWPKPLIPAGRLQISDNIDIWGSNTQVHTRIEHRYRIHYNNPSCKLDETQLKHSKFKFYNIRNANFAWNLIRKQTCSDYSWKSCCQTCTTSYNNVTLSKNVSKLRFSEQFVWLDNIRQQIPTICFKSIDVLTQIEFN